MSLHSLKYMKKSPITKYSVTCQHPHNSDHPTTHYKLQPHIEMAKILLIHRTTPHIHNMHTQAIKPHKGIQITQALHHIIKKIHNIQNTYPIDLLYPISWLG